MAKLHLIVSVALASLAAAVACSDSDEAEVGANGGASANGGTQSGGTSSGGSSASSSGGSSAGTSNAGTANGGTSNGGTTSGGTTSGGTSNGGTANGGTTTGGTAGSGGCVVRTCQGKVYECGDCIDNDGDGDTDSADTQCLGPCDNTEGSYYGGIPGQNNSPCRMDCYFDQDTGPGNDQCYWNHRCDKLAVAPDYPPSDNSMCAYDEGANTPGTPKSCEQLRTDQSMACESFCGPLTPNGCDCFGCCELPAGGGQYVFLGSEDENGDGSCTIDDVGDPSKCHPCTPVPSCLNPCGKCEVCIGKPTLPPECFPPDGGAGAGGAAGSGTGGSGSTQCPFDLVACGQPGQDPCPSDKYCVTGCCVDIIK